MMKAMTKKFRHLAAVMSIVAMATGCDAVVDPGNHPIGVVFIREDGTEAASYVDRTAIAGTLTVPLGGTETYQVKLITGSGQAITLNEAEHTLGEPRLVITSLGAVSLQGNDQITLTGLVTGNTTLRFDLFHGDHREFEVRDISVWILQEGAGDGS